MPTGRMVLVRLSIQFSLISNSNNQINVDVIYNVALLPLLVVVCKLLCIPLAVDQEGTSPGLDVADHLVAL